jgi:hypothetical protein
VGVDLNFDLQAPHARVARGVLDDGAARLEQRYTTAVLLSPGLTIPVELEKEIAVLDVPLPTFRDLAQLLKEIVEVLRQDQRISVNLSREQAEQLCKAAMGLTLMLRSRRPAVASPRLRGPWGSTSTLPYRPETRLGPGP